MKTILYNPIFINPQAYYVFPRLTRWLRPDNGYKEPANYIGQIEVTIIAYGEIGYTEYFEHTNYIDFTNFSNSYVRISLFTRLGSCVLGEWKIGAMESDRPYIEPEVLASLKAVVIVGDKTNQDKDRDTVANLVDASNPFVISNAAYNLNSGYGLYAVDFTKWSKRNVVTSNNDNSFSFESKVSSSLLYYSTTIDVDTPSFKIKADISNCLVYYYYINDKGTLSSISIIESGEFELPISHNTLYNGNIGIGFEIGRINGTGTGTITQIPSYQGAFVTDGVNDLIISTKTVQEMLGESNEITVVSMIHQVADRGSTYPNIYNNQIRYSTRLLRSTVTAANVVGKTGIYGYTATGVSITGTPTGKVVNDILGDKNDYPYLTSAFTGIDAESHFSVEGYLSDSDNIIETSSVAWYWTIIANKVLTTDQINQVIAYYDLDKYLEPTVLYNVKRQGLSNDTSTSEWYLKDYSKNGYDMTLNNFSKAGGSGIAAKQGESTKDWSIIKDEGRQELTIYNEFKYKVKSNEKNHYWSLQYINYSSTSYPVTIIADRDCFWSNYVNLYDKEGNKQSQKKEIAISANTPTQVLCCGFDEFPDVPEGYHPTTAVSYAFLKEAGELTIEFIPSCEGGLITDGVNDFGKVTGLPIYKDYTVIADYERISDIDNAWTGALVSKAYIANPGVDGDTLWLGTYRDNYSSFFNGAIYSLMTFPYSMSEFLIERQLKKYELGTLHPGMIEFRPTIESNIDIKKISYWDTDWNVIKAGDYISVGNNVKTNITVPAGYKIVKASSDAFDNITIEKSSTEFIYDVKFYNLKKTPQRITLELAIDENYVQWNPTVQSNIAYKSITYRRIDVNPWTTVNIGDYLPIGTRMQIVLGLYDSLDEVSSVDSDQLNNISINGNEITYTLTSASPQIIDITIDEYIRYEDMDFTSAYPFVPLFQGISWGDKLKVGDEVKFIGFKNILPDIYIRTGEMKLNGNNLVTNSSVVIGKSMIFEISKNYTLDNNAPKCILSPSRLRIPNSSYKILGYIPDLSGNGNHGIINNSAYAEGSGVNADGSYQLDGVDDFISIPTTVGGKQVLMKVIWDDVIADAILYDQRGYPNEFAIYNADNDNSGNPVTAYQARNNGKTYIDGILNSNIKASELKNVNHIITITNELSSGANNSSPIIGSNRVNDAYFTKMSLYDFMLFDGISTDEEILNLNKYIGIEPKVTVPPYYWDAYGRSNVEAAYDRALMLNLGKIPSNGTTNALTAKNMAWDEMSGYGGYSFKSFDTASRWNVYPGSGETAAIEIVSRNGYSITLKKKLDNVYSWQFNYGSTVTNLSDDLKFNVMCDKTIRVMWQFKYRLVEGESYRTETISSHDLTPNVEAKLTLARKTPEQLEEMGVLQHYYLIFFGNAEIAIDEEYTITMLPIYPNGLCIDGVTDYLSNANIPAFTDYTYVLKRELLDLDKAGGNASMYKGSFVPAGGRAFIADYYINSGVGTDGAYGFSFGSSIKSPTLLTDKTVYGTKTSVNGVSITPGPATDDASLTLGKWDTNYKQMVFYKLMLYPQTLTNLEIMFLKNLFERDEIIDLTNPIFIQ